MNSLITQEQLNAATFIRGLIDLNMININPKYGFGAETRMIVSQHINSWDYHNRKQLVETLESIIEILGTQQDIRQREVKVED